MTLSRVSFGCHRWGGSAPGVCRVKATCKQLSEVVTAPCWAQQPISGTFLCDSCKGNCNLTATRRSTIQGRLLACFGFGTCFCILFSECELHSALGFLNHSMILNHIVFVVAPVLCIEGWVAASLASVPEDVSGTSMTFFPMEEQVNCFCVCF